MIVLLNDMLQHCNEVNKKLKSSSKGRDIPGALRATGCRRGLEEVAVACFGAGGGLLSPGTKSNIGSSLSSTPFLSARLRPSCNGIQVPMREVSAVLSLSRLIPQRTLVFAVSSLHLLMDTLLDFSFKDPGTSRLVEVGDFQDVGRIDPVV